MGEANKKEDEDEKLIPVGPGAEGLAEAAAPEKDEEPEDKRLAAGDEDQDADDDKDAAPGKKKESARERRERKKVADARLRLERNYYEKRTEDLEKRLMTIEGRTAQTETAAIDTRITNIHQQLANADRVLADALRKPNGGGAEEFVEAQKIRDQLRDQLSQLSTAKQSHERQTQQQATQRREPAREAAPDPIVIRNAQAWAAKHEWFDFNGADEHSAVVKAIDEALTNEGLDPATRDYWDELTSRVKRRLPEKFKGVRGRADEDDDNVDDDEDEKPRAKSGPKFSSGGRERPLKKGEVYVSAERKEAMKQYGVWDDPVARNRMLKKYAQWDAETPASSNR